MSYAIGIDLGASRIKAVAVTAAGETLAQAVLPFDAGAKMDWAQKIRAIVEQLQGEQSKLASHLAVSAPGLVAKDGRSIAHMPGRLQGLEGLDWSSLLDVPGAVPVLNDAHAALLGEAWLGAAKGFENVILLTLGTGVGGAAIVDGRLLHGHLGRAGHLGHLSLDLDGPPDICGTPGSLEMMIGNCTVAARTNGRFQTTQDLVGAHLAGDAQASRVWLRSVRALACAIASFVNILDPEAVIIGGGIARCHEALFEPLLRLVAEVEWKSTGYQVKVLPARLGEYAGAFGAAGHALRQDR